jgi:hypothetical protein
MPSPVTVGRMPVGAAAAACAAGVDAVRVGRVPCAHWNAEESSWPRLGPETKLIHVKGRFRQALSGGLIVDLAKDRATLKPLVAKFHDWEKEALAHAA